MKKILIIEDNKNILQALISDLKSRQFEVITAGSIKEGCSKIKTEKPDLIISALILTDKNGLYLCQEMRDGKIDIPVLMLTSKAKRINEVLGFQMGSGDYNNDHFSINKLSEKIDNLLAKSENDQAAEITDYSFEDIQLNFSSHEAVKNGLPMDLSDKEYKILKYLIQHNGEVITKDQILDNVWGYEAFPSTHAIDQYVYSIREKIENDPANPTHLLTVSDSYFKFIA